MKMQTRILAVVVALAFALLVGLVDGREEKRLKKGEVIPVSSSEAVFEELVPGVSKSVLWGDHENGPYGAFTRFSPGIDNGMHTHSNDVRIVVLEGAYLYRDKAGEKRVGPGSFILVPGGKTHWSGGDAEEGALFYEESSAGFDLIPHP